MVTYLVLAYDGNYVGRTKGGKYEMFTYDGELYFVDPVDDIIFLM